MAARRTGGWVQQLLMRDGGRGWVGGSGGDWGGLTMSRQVRFKSAAQTDAV